MVVRPRLVCVPSNDVEFAAHANEQLTALDAPASERVRAELERRLRARYPGAVVRAQDPLARVAGSDDVVWYATNRTYRSRISAALDIAAPTELVFATYIDRFPDWQRSVALRPVGSDGRLVGREFAASYSIFGRRFEGRFRIVDADPPRFVRIEARGAGGIRVWYATSFAPTEDGRTHLDVLGDYDVPGTLFPRVQRLVLEQVIGRDIDRAHADLVALCEREIEREMTTEAASTASTTASPR